MILLGIAAACATITSCGSNESTGTDLATDTTLKASVSSSDSGENKTQKENKVQPPKMEATEPELPKPDIELPTLPFDKSKLPQVMKLDELIMDDAWLETSYNLVYKELQLLEEKSELSMSGTSEDIVKVIMTKVNAVDHFNGFANVIAEMAIEKFISKYATDQEFGEQYRTAYYAAEEEIMGGTIDDGNQIIQDKVKRREVGNHFHVGYTPSRSSELSSMQDLLEDASEIRENVIQSVISQANIDMMVADYKKGKELTDMLNGTIDNLRTVQRLNPEHESLLAMVDKVAQKKKDRIEEVLKSLHEYRFPERYSGGNAPSNASTLEDRMEDFLSGFEYRSGEKYDVLEIKVAGPWIDLYHTLTGAHIYSQIDFYVAVPADEDGVVDVLFVTGKTSGPHHESFGTYSVGGMGQMLEENL